MPRRTKKTAITSAELARLDAILRESAELDQRVDALLAEANEITGDESDMGHTFDAVTRNLPYTAEQLVRRLGLAIVE
jgi:hypothetical protein